MSLATANPWNTVAWINEHRPAETDCLVIFDGVIENRPGLTTVRVNKTDRFHPKDTLIGVVDIFTGHYGECTARSGLIAETIEYQWKLSDTRWLRVIGKSGIGVFIQLIDKGTV